MVGRTVAEIPVEELKSWQSKRLLGRLRALQRLEQNLASSDWSASDLADEADIRFKADKRWTAAYEDVIRLLDSREHIRRGRTARLERIRSR